jgi:hypothetical protein
MINTKTTPADCVLHSDCTNDPRQDSWHYRLVLGKLNFLAQNTRPDISFAVHQCALYCTKPTALHELVLKCIMRYLVLTSKQGLILHPNKEFCIDMYVDADFAGLWHQQHSTMRDCVLSRTSYITSHATIGLRRYSAGHTYK